MKHDPIRILLVDDHRLFRKALMALIKGFGSAYIMNEACDGQEALEIIATTPVDLILLDIQMPRMGGMETLKQIRHQKLQTKVVMLTQFEDRSLILYALQLGANGFLLKTSDPSELKRAINEVMDKGQYFDNRVTEALDTHFSKHPKLSKLDISPREFQVLTLLKDGKTTKEVASNLGLTLRTIESYRKNLIKKTHCRNTVDLVSLAYRTGILPTSI